MAKPINYIYIPVAELYMEVSNTDPAETKDWMLGVLTSVIKQERGVYELADRIIDEADAFRKITDTINEAFEAYTACDREHCLQELAQCGAVILRMMQFVQDEMEATK